MSAVLCIVRCFSRLSLSSRVNFFQLISRVEVGGDDEMFELLIFSRIGLWSEDNSFKFVVFTGRESLIKAMSKTSGLLFWENGKYVGVSGAEMT